MRSSQAAQPRHFGGTSVATASTVQLLPFAILPADTTSLTSNYHIGKFGLNYRFGADQEAAQWSDGPLYAKSAGSVQGRSRSADPFHTFPVYQGRTNNHGA